MSLESTIFDQTYSESNLDYVSGIDVDRDELLTQTARKDQGSEDDLSENSTKIKNASRRGIECLTVPGESGGARDMIFLSATAGRDKTVNKLSDHDLFSTLTFNFDSENPNFDVACSMHEDSDQINILKKGEWSCGEIALEINKIRSMWIQQINHPLQQKDFSATEKKLLRQQIHFSPTTFEKCHVPKPTRKSVTL